jgi:hypothetical protein
VTERDSSQKVDISPDSFVRRTGQLWKLVLGGIVLPILVVAWGLWTMRRIRPDQPTGEVAVQLTVLIAGAIVIAALLSSVRCPRCHGRVLLRVMRDPEGVNAIVAFLTQRSCGVCGHSPADDSA